MLFQRFDKRLPHHFIAPRYWPAWIVVGLMWIVGHLPYSLQLSTGHLLGFIARATARRRRLIAATNIRLCFPELDRSRQAALVRRHFAALGMSAIEMAMAWWAPRKKLAPLVRTEGLEYLEQALAQGKGALMLTGHFTTLEIGGRFLSFVAPMHLVYRPHHNPLIEAVIRSRRESHIEHAIPRTDIRALIKSLRTNHAVWYAPDQGYRGKHSVMVPFFDIPAPSAAPTSRITKLSGTVILPFFVKRLPGRQGYVLRIEPALEDFPVEDAIAGTRRFHQMLEGLIRQAPEQYLWTHDRFKLVPR